MQAPIGDELVLAPLVVNLNTFRFGYRWIVRGNSGACFALAHLPTRFFGFPCATHMDLRLFRCVPAVLPHAFAVLLLTTPGYSATC